MRPTWRTTLIAVLASVLLASSLFAQTLTVRVSRGNVRAQPSKSSPIIGKINKGEVYDTEGRQGNWFKIRLETGREGWVFKSLVEGTPHQIGKGLDTMVLVPAGSFLRGSTAGQAQREYEESKKKITGAKKEWFDREVPQRRVYLDAFYIDKYPVTNVRFARFVEATSHRTEAEKGGGGRVWDFSKKKWEQKSDASWRAPTGGDSSYRNRLRHPVVQVSRKDARSYCGWAGKGLPTEAEWEKAARGVNGRKYPWGNDWADGSKVIWGKNSGGKTHPVDRTYNTHRSPYGAVDMSGNTWDWVSDWFGEDYYQNAPARNPKGPATGTRRVVRGGSWLYDFPADFRTASRGGYHPVVWFDNLGFRCAKAPFASIPKGTGDLFLNSKPPGAVVFLDGKRLSGPTPLLVEKVPAGEHRILLRKGETYGGFRDVRLKAGELKNLTVSLERLKGELYVKVRPFGSEVLVDGKRLGKSPLKTKVNTGERQVEVRQEGYRRYSGRVKVEFGKTTEVSQTLAALPTGTLVVSSTPSGAEIFIGKKSVGKTPRAIRLYEGEYTVRFRKPGYKPSSQKALVRGDRKSTVVAVLAVDPIPGGMVKVPAGWFIMGSEKYESEKPRRRVYLDKFFIDKYPVTNVRFRRFGRPKKDHGSKFNGARQPVVGVTWAQARDYCGSVGKRLPTEAEWEKAARGLDGRQYPWGNQWDPSKMIWDKNSGDKTHPVDRTYNTSRSPYGAVDMSGNVYEWVRDWYKADYYRSAPARNPKGPSSGNGRVVRGGAWVFNPTFFRAAFRYRYHPDYRDNYLGFRCAKAP